MTEPGRKKLMYGVLVAAVIFGVYNFAQPRKKLASPADSFSAQASTTSPVAAPEKSINVAEKQAEPWGRDPFRSGSTPAPAVTRPRVKVMSNPSVPQPVWHLTGIMFNKRQPMAFINGRMVGIGDEIDQAKVSRIEQSKVTIIYNGSPIDLLVTKG